MERKRKRDGGGPYPRRIAGISFGEEDYQRIQVVCRHYGLTEAQVVRGSVSYGLGAYDPSLHQDILDAAEEFSVDERLVVLGALKEGLPEYERQIRSRWRHEQLRKFREDLVKANRAEDRDLDQALRDYLERHADRLEDLMEEEEFFQKTIDREDEQQDEEDRERQADFDKVVGKRPGS